MEKVIRNGKVAILISPGFGAGWYSWNTDHKELLFHSKLVEMVEQNRQSEITDEWVKDNLGINRNKMTPQELQQKLIEKKNRIAEIVGKKEAERLIEKAMKLVAEGKKSILDIIDIE